MPPRRKRPRAVVQDEIRSVQRQRMAMAVGLSVICLGGALGWWALRIATADTVQQKKVDQLLREAPDAEVFQVGEDELLPPEKMSREVPEVYTLGGPDFEDAPTNARSKKTP